MDPLGIVSVAAQAATALTNATRATPQSADLTFLAYLDLWIISGLVLLAVVVVAGKFAWSKLRGRDEGEGYDWRYDDPWDGDDEYDGRR